MKNTAIVIGGSSGIGKAICNKLKRNYNVVNMSRRKCDGVDNIFADVTSLDCLKTAFANMYNRYGSPQILIYSAGFVEPQGIMEIDEQTLDKTIKTNLCGAFYCTQEFVKYQKDGGKIIYIASTAGTRPQPAWSAYASAKAGLINFALTMSEELRSYDIKTYCISLGRCNTPLREILEPNEDKTKIMQPNEVADIVETLINDNGLLNGQNIIIKKEIRI